MTMITRSIALCVVCLVALGAAVSARAATKADMRAEVQFFYDELAPYGRWVDHRLYGIVWVPDSGVPDWHPYTYGRWVWTADYGWYWDSDEDFGWATYHYGRWVLTSDYGWVWVPDDVWGPGWVDWRYSEGYVGWAPMPPEWRWRNSALVTARVDLGAPGYAAYWTFVAEDSFARGEVRERRLASADVKLRLGASQRVTNYSTVKGRVYSRGVDVVKLRASTRVPLPAARVKVTESVRSGAHVREAGIITVYRPRLVARSKLDLEADIPTRFDAEVNTTVQDHDVPPSVGADAEVEAGAGAWSSSDTRIESRAPETSIGVGSGIGVGGGGIGIGAGGGGGLRIGR